MANRFKCTLAGGSAGGNTLVVTCDSQFAGKTISATKSGTIYTKQCPSVSPYTVEFSGLETGTWTISAVIDGVTYETEAIVQDISAVLVADFKWKDWVDLSVDLDSSDYATLDDLLADEKAVRELMLVHACVDFLAAITKAYTSAAKIINNGFSAKWINLCDYALDTLYANTHLASMMDAADKYFYGELECNVNSVPAMTSATTPSGVVSSDNYYQTDYDWKAFDGDDSTFWYAMESLASGLSEHYVQYDFGVKKYIDSAKVLIQGHSSTAHSYSYKFYGSYDGVTFTEIVSGSVPSITLSSNYTINETLKSNYRYYRFGIKSNSEASVTAAVMSIELLGEYSPKGNVPVMTANTSPYGEAIGSGTSDGSSYFWVFNGNSSNGWYHNPNSQPQYVGYKFTNPVKVKKAIAVVSGISPGSAYTWSCKIQGYDGTNWVDVSDAESTGAIYGSNRVTLTFDVTSDYYLQYRMQTSGHSASPIVYSLQFYGRQLSVSVPVMTSNTAPFGEVIYSSIYSSGYEGYRAFDNDNSTRFNGDNTLSNNYIGYHFTKPVLVRFVYMDVFSGGEVRGIDSYKIQGSNTGDSDDWHDVYSETATEPISGTHCIIAKAINNTTPYEYYRVYSLGNTTTGETDFLSLFELQFYGLDYSEKEYEAGSGKKWLYDHGLEFVTFESTGFSDDNYSFTLPTKNSSYIQFSTNSGTNEQVYMTDIDISDYALARAKRSDDISVYSDGKCGHVLAASSKTLSGHVANATPITPAILANNCAYCDISNITSNYWIGIQVWAGKKFAMSELWLEPTA